jgi:hypothetical protein
MLDDLELTDNDRPIYQRLADAIGERIARGELVAGERLPPHHRVRQHDGVGRGMGQVKSAPEQVPKLVMQRHPDRAEADATEPCAIKCMAAGFAVTGPFDDGRRCIGQCANAFRGHQRNHGIAIARIQSFDRVSDCVDARGRGETRGQQQGQVDIVDHDLGQNLASSTVSVTSSGNDQVSPDASNRRIVSRTVDGAEPTRQVISRNGWRDHSGRVGGIGRNQHSCCPFTPRQQARRRVSEMAIPKKS